MTHTLDLQAMEDRVYARAVAEFERIHPDLATLRRDRDALLEAAKQARDSLSILACVELETTALAQDVVQEAFDTIGVAGPLLDAAIAQAEQS